MYEEHRLIIPAILGRIRDACDFVVRGAQNAGLNEKAVHHCQLAVDEACTNVIEHGYQPAGTTGQIEIVYRDEEERFSISILDNSPSFDPFTRIDPDPDTALSERERGGWGIYFIKKLADEVSYAFENGRNRLTITKLKVPKHLAHTPVAQAMPGIPVRALPGDYWEITPMGRLDSNTAPDLETTFDAQMSAGRFRFVVNMTDVTYTSTSGLKVLVKAWRRVQEHGGDLLLAGMRPFVLEVFEIVGFDQVFDIYDTLDDALEHLAEKKA